MNRNKKNKGVIFARWPFWVGIIAALLIVGVSTASLKGLLTTDDSESTEPFYEAKQGPLTISITESGTIKSSEMDIIKNEVEGQAAILYLIPEGTVVKKGELLVELDSSEVQDELVDQEIRMKNADSASVSATANLEVVKNQAQSDVERAQLDYQFAQQDLQKYKEGDYPKALNESKAKIQLAQEELKRAEEKAKWSDVLYGEKYLSQTEKEADQLAAQKRKLDLELAQNDMKLLEQFTYTRQMAQLESDVAQKKMALERVQQKAKANVTEAESNKDAKALEFKRQEGKYKKLQEQIAKAKIYAPSEGLVVYATSSEGDFRGNDEPLQEGQMVRERQELIHLPRTASFIAQAKIHESSLEKIRLGLPARLTVDAVPGKTYTGRVSKIAPLPDAISVFMNPDLKVYSTEIAIDGEASELRTGMSCRAEIIVDQLPNAVYVPVQAVTRVGKSPSVYVAGSGQWLPRTVDIGLDNNRLIHIKSGLKPGERVLLTPPLESAGMAEADQSEQDENQKLLASAAAAPAAAAPRTADQPTSGTAGGPAGPSGGAEGMPDFSNMTDEQRQQLRSRMENMSPEEQAKRRAEFTERMKAAGIPMGADGRPDMSKMTEEQRSKMMEQFRGAGGRSRGDGQSREGGFGGREGGPRGGEGRPDGDRAGSEESGADSADKSSSDSTQAGE